MKLQASQGHLARWMVLETAAALEPAPGQRQTGDEATHAGTSKLKVIGFAQGSWRLAERSAEIDESPV